MFGRLQPRSRRSRPTVLLFITAVLLLTSWSAFAASAERYVGIDGEITLRSYTSSGGSEPRNPQVTNRFDFHCLLGRDQWRITSEFPRNAVEEFSFDGTNVYRVTTFTQLPKHEEGTTPVYPPSSVETLEELNDPGFLSITPGSHPLSNAGVNLIWLAFCSGEYLARDDLKVPLPISEVQHTLRSLAYRDVTEVFDDELRLPKKMQLYESPELLEAAKDDPRIFSRKRMGPPRVSEGRLGCEYVVQSTTTDGGWIIPSEFRLVQKEFGGDGTLLRRTIAEGRVRSVSNGEPPDGPFQERRAFRVADQRFRSDEKVVDSIRYNWDKGYVPDTNNPRLVKIFQEKMAKTPSRAEWRLQAR